MKRSLKSLSLMFALGCATACGEDLAQPSQEESGFELEGEVQSLNTNASPGQARVALVWDNWIRNGDQIHFQELGSTHKTVPFSYKLRVREYPSSSYLNDFLGNGLLGTAYIAVYEDTNGDKAANEGEPMLGLAPKHLVLFAPEVTPALQSILKEWGGIVNVEDLKPGFNLARGVCQGEGEFDLLQIIPKESIRITSEEEFGQTSCVNFH